NRLNMLRSLEYALQRSSGIVVGQVSDLQKALRLTNDPQVRADILRTLQSIYDFMSMYRWPKFTKISLSTNSDSIADNLFLLGLYDEALPELLAKRTPNNGASLSDEDYTIALLSLRAGIQSRAVRFG